MVEKPSEPSSLDPPQEEGHARAAEQAQQQTQRNEEGPLAVERLSKEDGRSLILYTDTRPAP
jgi:hypothetical protein